MKKTAPKLKIEWEEECLLPDGNYRGRFMDNNGFCFAVVNSIPYDNIEIIERAVNSLISRYL